LGNPDRAHPRLPERRLRHRRPARRPHSAGGAPLPADRRRRPLDRTDPARLLPDPPLVAAGLCDSLGRLGRGNPDRGARAVGGARLGLVVSVACVLCPSGIKPPQSGLLVYEKESAYHDIQVVQDGPRTALLLNEGEAIHSIYDSGSLTTGGPWDYFLIADQFRPAATTEVKPRDV